jgi:hypothetical protein
MLASKAPQVTPNARGIIRTPTAALRQFYDASKTDESCLLVKVLVNPEIGKVESQKSTCPVWLTRHLS